MKAPLQLSHSLTFVRVASSFLQYSIDGVLVKTSRVFVLEGLILKVFDFDDFEFDFHDFDFHDFDFDDFDFENL